MATRKETSTRRQALHDELRLACRNGTLPIGEPLPSVRELAGRYSVSFRVVSDAIQTLTSEGLLYSVPRRGTFVGNPHQMREGLYVLVTPKPPQNNEQLSRMQYGFEEQISRLGGSCLSLPLATAQAAFSADEPLIPAGLFYMGEPQEMEDALTSSAYAKVIFAEEEAHESCGQFTDSCDVVYFDNSGGGYQVTHYLLQQGHSRIAFLGLHDQNNPSNPYTWSRERAAGWQRALHEAGYSDSGLAFLPNCAPEAWNIDQQVQESYQQALQMIQPLYDGAITSVVTANVHATHGLFQALQEVQVPAELWPVVTTFGVGDANVSMMTSMLLPWEQLGREAADLLWNRSRGAQSGPGLHVSVPMRLITRLTCRPAWKVRPEAALWTALAAQ